MHIHNIEKEVMRVSYLDGAMEGFGKKRKGDKYYYHILP